MIISKFTSAVSPSTVGIVTNCAMFLGSIPERTRFAVEVAATSQILPQVAPNSLPAQSRESYSGRLPLYRPIAGRLRLSGGVGLPC